MRRTLRNALPARISTMPFWSLALSAPLLLITLAGCPDLTLQINDSNGVTAGLVAQERSCWDLNEDGIGDPSEDINGDGNFDELDCDSHMGPAGPTGPEGPAGADGISCWDLDGDGQGDPEEDVNDDGAFNALDCAGTPGATGATGPAGPAGPTGATGPEGPPGDGTTYGNGSAGPKVVSVSTTLTDTDLRYTDFTINTGITLTVPSGAVIRCTGNFTNNGTIVVQTSARGGTQNGTAPVVGLSDSPAHPGVTLSAAAAGEYGSNATTRVGGAGGVAPSAFAARYIYLPGANAGGGGGGARAALGGYGGGSLVVLAQLGVVNFGTITANGAAGAGNCGGGGGGIVVLASSGLVANSGTINALGGNGGASSAAAGAGGGGGGGIVHLIGPNVVPGTINLQGGAAGSTAVSITADPRQGGGGGGACGGNGGAGGSVTAAGAASAATAGSTGQFLTTYIDPIWLY